MFLNRNPSDRNTSKECKYKILNGRETPGLGPTCIFNLQYCALRGGPSFLFACFHTSNTCLSRIQHFTAFAPNGGYCNKTTATFLPKHPSSCKCFLNVLWGSAINNSNVTAAPHVFINLETVLDMHGNVRHTVFWANVSIYSNDSIYDIINLRTKVISIRFWGNETLTSKYINIFLYVMHIDGILFSMIKFNSKYEKIMQSI